MAKYEKSEAQKQKEIEKVKLYLKYMYEDGKGKCQAAALAGGTYGGMEKLRARYVPNSFEDQLKAGNFDPHTWDHGWLKTDDFSIHIRNGGENVTYEDIRDEMISAMKEHAPKYPKIERKKSKEGHLLIVDPCDPHIGKLAVRSETGDDYNLDVVQRRMKDGLEGLLEKASGFEIDKILLIIGNDILHVDNAFRTTTAGTKQDTVGQWHESMLIARDIYIYIVECLLPIAPVHIVFNPSNHDFVTGFPIGLIVQAWFKECKDITFDIDMMHRKYFRYGNSLIGTTHGDSAKEKDLGSLMSDEVPKLWGDTQYRYMYCHHMHHKIAKEYIGMTVEYVRSITSADSWHHRNGYITHPAAEGFIHSKNHGQIARLTTYVH